MYLEPQQSSLAEAVPRLGDNTGGYLRIDTAQELSTSMVDSLNGLCDRVEDGSGDSVVVLYLHDATDNLDRAWPGKVGIHTVNRWERALRRVERLDAVTIAVAEGHCGGPALEVLLATDYRIGTPDLRLDPPHASGEFWPGMGMHRLAQQVGIARARRLVHFPTELSGDLAMQFGLVDELAADVVEAVGCAAEVAIRASGPERGIRRLLLLETTTTSYEEALGIHLAACDRALRRADAARNHSTPQPEGA